MNLELNCSVCGNTFNLNNDGRALSPIPRDYHENYLCPDCADSLYRCAQCNNLVSEDEAEHLVQRHDRYVETLPYCPECARNYFHTCHYCGEEWHIRHMLWTANSNRVCYPCFENYMFECDSCGEIYDREDCFEHTITGDDLCIHCHRDQQPGNIHSYGYKPYPPNFKSTYRDATQYGRGDNMPFMGVELEIEAMNGDIHELSDIIRGHDPNENLLYQKSDGSLNNGIEIVSHPATLRYHRDYMPWKQLLSDLAQAGARSHDARTCGLHIHLSKNSVKPVDLIKTVYLYYSPTWQTLLTRVCRRHLGTYHAMTGKDVSKPRLHLATNAHSRYELVNTNHVTIEFRQPRGTLKYTSFMAALELVTSLREFVGTQGITHIIDTAKTLDRYCLFVLTHDEYINLAQFVRDLDEEQNTREEL